MYTELVEHFCKPPFRPFTDFDKKAIASATPIEIPFGNDRLRGYCWGTGKTILLIHGWGSRASHLALLGNTLAKSGFRVVAIDAPAHSSINGHVKKEKSNMFEFSQAISAAVAAIGPVYAIVGHSLGAIASVFVTAGYMRMAEYKVPVDKLVLMGMPASLESVIAHYGRENGLDPLQVSDLISGLETGFDFKVADYRVDLAFKNVNSDILLIHGTEDHAISIDEAHSIKNTFPQVKLLTLENVDHYNILINRRMMTEVKGFLKEIEN